MNRLFIINIIIISGLLSNGLFAQQTNLKFGNLSTENGLSNDFVTCIIKDYKGYLWIGTNEGLDRYDARNFYIYEKTYSDTTSISNNLITTIYEDRNEQLWIGTHGGLNLYNRSQDNFIRFLHNEKDPCSISQNHIGAIYQDSEGIYWIGTFGGGLNRYDSHSKKFIRYLHQNDDSSTIGQNNITCIFEDTDKNLWFGTLDGISLLTDKKKGIFTTFRNDGKPGSIKGNYVTSIISDNIGNVWVATRDQGLFKMEKTKGPPYYRFIHIKLASNSKESIASLNILHIQADQNNILWLGTENSGLYLYNFKNNTIFNFKNNPENLHSLRGNSIWYIYRDRENIVWLSDYNKGLDFFDINYSKFEGIKSSTRESNALNNNNITGFAEDNKGNLWISTDGGGLNYWDRVSNRFSHFMNGTSKNSLVSNAVICILMDSKQNLWCGTWGGGLNVKRNGNNEFTRFPSSDADGFIHSDKIISLSEDNKGRIWVGTVGRGIYYYNPESKNFTQVLCKTRDSLLLKFANIWAQMHSRRNNNVWIATSYGIFVIKEQPNGLFNAELIRHDDNRSNTLSEDNVQCLFQDSKNNIWIGTSGGGLNKYIDKDGTFIKFMRSDGLPSNSIRGILEDNKGILWISTSKGICQFDPVTSQTKNYSTSDGLFNEVFSGNACLKTKSGLLFFGSYYGINYFNPDNILINKNIPPVYISDLKIFNHSVPINKDRSPLIKPIYETDLLTLNYTQSVFTLEFVALNFSHPEKNKYQYILEGFDNKWNDVGTQRSATYTNLKAGNYTFKIKGSNNDGIWNETPVTLKIKILPPFWKSNIALVFYLFGLFVTIALFIRIRVARTREKDLIKLEKLRIGHEEELNRNKIQFFTNISHEFRTPLTLMIGPLEQILKKGNIVDDYKEKLRLVYKNTKRLTRLIDELMDFTKIENKKFKLNPQYSDIEEYIRNIHDYFLEIAIERHITFSFKSTAKPLFVWFDRNKLDKVFFNLLSNAFKATPEGGKIEVTLELFKKDTPEWLETLKNISLNTNKFDGKSFIKITVNDNGSGIPPEHQPFIFESFFQANQNSTLNFSGTGIGLYLAKSIVELHHGMILVESTVNIGSTFNVYLPVDSDYKGVKTENEDREHSSSLSKSVVNVDDLAYQEKKVPDVHFEMDSKKNYTILLAEDNPELRKYLKNELQDEYKIWEARSGNSAYELLLQKQPDVIISDIIMPDGDGIELCSRVKHNKNINHIPVILLTAKSSINDKIEGTRSGADEYIEKPFDINYLKAKINQLIINRKILFSKFVSTQNININNSTNSVEQQFIELFRKKIFEQISDPELSVESLAKEMGLSRSQVYRKIKAITQLSANDYIKIVKLEYARKMLENQPVSINEVAFQIGFTSPSYFTKCFKEVFNMLPMDIINAKKNLPF